MLDRFVSAVWQLLGTKTLLARPRVRRSRPVMVESLEVRRMLTAPAITAPIAGSVNQAGSFAFTGGNAISINDGAGTEMFSFAVHHGQLNFASTSGLIGTGNGSSTVVLSGTATAINAALATFTYTPDSNYSGPDSLGMYVRNLDSNQDTSAVVSLTVTPAISISSPATVNLNHATSLSFTGGNAISFNDVFAGTENFSLTALHGTLNFGSTTGLTVSGNGSSAVTLSGTTTAINAALGTLSYTANSNYSGPDSIGFYVLNSTANHSLGKSISLTHVGPFQPPTIDLYPVEHVSQNTAVTLAGPGFSTYEIHISSGDPDSASDLYQVIVSVSHGTLSIAATTGVTIQNNNTGTLTLAGVPNDINTALAKLQYTPTNNFIGSDTVNVSAKDTVTNLTSNASKSIVVTPSITAPTITAPSAFSANHGTFDFSGSNAIHYYDAGPGTTESFSMVVHHGVLNFNLNVQPPAGIVLNTGAIYGNHSSVVIVSGTADQIFGTLELLSYTPDNGYKGSDTLGMYVVNSSNNQSTSAMISITVAPTNLSPSIISPSETSIGIYDTSLSFGNSIVFSDGPGTDNFSLVVQHGQLNVGSTTGLTVSGNGSSVVMLSGTAAAISSALKTINYTRTAPGATGNYSDDSLTMYVSNSTTNLSTSAAMKITNFQFSLPVLGS